MRVSLEAGVRNYLGTTELLRVANDSIVRYEMHT